MGKKLAKYFLESRKETSIRGIDRSGVELTDQRYSHRTIDLSRETIPDLKDHDAVIHLAGQPSVWQAEENPLEDFNSNVYTMLNMLLSIKEARIPILFLSTIALYAPSEDTLKEENEISPDNWYGMSKFTAENYCIFFCKKYDIPFVIMRAGFIYDRDVKRGPVADSRKRGDLYRFNNPDTVLDFLHIEDLYRGIQKIIDGNFRVTGIFNISSGKPVSIREIGEAAGQEIPDTPASKPPRRMVMDISKFSGAYGWSADHDVLEDIRKYL